MATIKVKDVKEYINRPYTYQGSCSSIYDIGNNLYFKYFDTPYRSLRNNDNREMLNTLEILMKLKGTTNLILPKDIYVTRSKILGYSMMKVGANALCFLKYDENIYKVVNNLLKLDKDINILASNHIDWDDAHNRNILYKDKFYLLDFDLSLYREYLSEEVLYQKVFYRVWYTFITTIFGSEYIIRLLKLNSLLEEKNFDIESYSIELITFLKDIQCINIEDINNRKRELINGYK